LTIVVTQRLAQLSAALVGGLLLCGSFALLN